MSYGDLIDELRDTAEVEGPGTLYHLLTEAAEAIGKLWKEVLKYEPDHGLE